MSEELFRKQAVDNMSQRLHGDVLIQPKLSHNILIGFLGLWLILLLIWVFSNKFSLKETVQGWTEASEGIVRIYAKNPGVVKEILVSEGEFVKEGQTLALIHSNKNLESGEVLEDKLLSEYKHQSLILGDQLNSSDRIYIQKKANLEKQISALETSLDLLEKQNITQNQIYSITSSQLSRYEALKEKGYVSMLDVDNILSKKLSLENELQSNMIQRVDLANKIEQLRSEMSLLTESNKNEVGSYKMLLSDNDQKISQLNSQKLHLIKATKSGTVSNLQVKEGQLIHSHESAPLFSIVPEIDHLIIHLLVPIRSSGFIKEGQALSVRYDAFPYEKFGIAKGQITHLSDITLLPNEVLNSPITIKEPAYRITAQMDKPYVEAYGKQIKLKHGMTLNADIILEQRTIFEWLMEPILSLKGRLQ